MASCLTPGAKRAGSSEDELASIAIKELPVDGYATYQVGLTALDTSIQSAPLNTFPKGAGTYNVSVTPGHYKIILDYFDANKNKIYSADYCKPQVANNDVHLIAGANNLAIQICNQTATVLDATVTIQPVLSAGSQTQNPANPSPVVQTQDVRQAMATHFDGMGDPYGGCGVPQSIVETSNFAALNVQNTPNNYSSYLQRPITQSASVGEFNNGLNCGRWIQVTLGNFCQGGSNSGTVNTQFCAGGQWVSNGFSGSTLPMLISDSCQDGNRWCRDDRYHIDAATSALTHFGSGVDASVWGNPQISWNYIDAPNYSGDIQIGFAKGAQQYWPAIIITHLQRGIHKVEQYINGSWSAQKMNVDLGQMYILTADPSGSFKIRIYDANDQLINGGRAYVFSMPAGCGATCSSAYTQTAYTTQ